MAFEMDNSFVRALRLLHSSSSESTEELRVLVDEAVKSKYGSGKELGPINNISAVFQEVVSATNSSSLNSIESLPKDEIQPESSSEELELDLLQEDLLCIVCKGMGVGARNRLVECSDCHNLYHQECHDPTVSDNEIDADEWTCSTCKDIFANKVSVPVEQSPSSISMSLYKCTSAPQAITPTKSYSDKENSDSGSTILHGSKSSSSSSSSTHTSKSSVSSRIITPNISLVIADKRIQIMKKKAAKMQEKRKMPK